MRTIHVRRPNPAANGRNLLFARTGKVSYPRLRVPQNSRPQRSQLDLDGDDEYDSDNDQGPLPKRQRPMDSDTQRLIDSSPQ